MDQPKENDQERGEEVQSRYTGLSVEFKNYIRKIMINKPTYIDDGILVMQKTLSNRDVNPQKGRLAFPSSSLILSQSQVEIYLRPGITVALVGPSLQHVTLVDVMIKKKKKNHPGRGSTLYVLTAFWNEVVTSNNLEAGQIVQLWAVRVDRRNVFALRRLTTEEGNNASGSGDTAANPSSSSSSDS